jgi:hypothetical protein
MPYNPTPTRHPNRRRAGTATIIGGAIVFVVGMLSNPMDTDTMIWGAVITGIGQLLSAFAE